MIKDINNDGKIDYKDILFYGLTLTGNILMTVFNIIIKG